MCSVSVILDQFQPHIPHPGQWQPQPLGGYPSMPTPEELRQLLDAFHKMLEGAREFDRLTGQPDCEDPEKAKLLERVAELERRLADLEVMT